MIEYKGIKWYFYHGALLPDVLPHKEIVLSKKEEKELLKKSKALFLRYTSHWDGEEGDFWYVIKDHFMGMDELSSNTRSKIRRGLKNCTVLKVSRDDVAQNGYETYSSAMKNYKTNLKAISKEEFIDNKKNSVNYDVWAVYDKKSGNMIGYSFNKIKENISNYTEIKFHPQYLKLYSSYALFYEMNRYYLEEQQFSYVNDGARSIAHSTNIQNFLIDKFKFRKAYCKLHIVYRRDIGLIVKALYPFKTLIQWFDFSIMNKVSTLLQQEEIRRSFE